MKQRLINSIKWYKIILLCGSIFFAIETTAQTLSQHNWYFGNSVNGIRFNRSTNIPKLVTDQAVPFGTGGSAVATDPSTADLLFYSDGDKIYNAFHQQMPKSVTMGTLKGNPAGNQPVVFCPVPGQTGKYFVFTNSASYTTGGKIFWNVIDMTLIGGAVFPAPALGDLENNSMTQIGGVPGTSEGMTIVPNSNGTDYWLIVHENTKQNYYALPITAASYPSGTFSPMIITSGLGLPTSVANFAYNRKLKKIGVSAQDTRTDAMFADFNPATGQFANATIISNSGVTTATNQSIYDMEWDVAGRYLYLSRVGETGINADVFQFDMLNGATNQQPNGTSLLSVLGGASIFRSWGLILAPDSTIYHLYQTASGGPFLLENFTQTDHRADSVIRNPLPFGAVNFGGSQFPQFTGANPNLTVGFTTIGTCQNNPTSFFPTVTPNADSLNWDFGDGSDTTLWSPNHTYAQAGSFNVTLTAYYQGQKKSVTQPVTITANQLKIQLVQDTTACRSEFPPPRGSSSPKQFSVTVKVTSGSASSYKWSNGQTTATLKPDSAGYYYVVVTDATSGCSAYAGVNVKEYKLTDQRSNVWYFGNKAGIDFNQRPPVALSNSAMTAPAGCAIISDRNGQTIFYTDGNNVYRYDEVTKTSSLIDTGIGGDPNSAQSAFIMPVPGDETLYYIFTTQAINGTSANELRYSLFDLKKNNGVGALVQKNVLLFSKSSEHLTGNTNWLIAHEYGNSTFRAYRISASGISDPVYSDIGSVESFSDAASGQGYMKLGPNDNLAVAVSNPGTSNLVDLFTFVDTTGVVTNYRKIDLKQPNGQVYGVEFSPGGNKIFATVKDTPTSTVYEYFLDSLGGPHFRNSTSEPGEIGAIQIAPNNQIYMAINNSSVLGTILANEDTTQVSTINISGFTLAGGTTSAIGLPNLRQQNGNGPGGPGFTFAGICKGDSTKFTGTPTDAIDKFQWFFGDGSGSTQSAPSHLYASAGTYTVRMRLTNRCGLDTTITQQVTIYDPPAKPSIPPAAVICTSSLTLDANTPNTPGLTYLWNTGATTKTISVSVPVIVNVTNTDVRGCSSKAQSIVVDNRPQVNLGTDQTVCQNVGIANLDAQNTGATYAWTVKNVTAGLPGTVISTSTTQTQSVSTAAAGIFNYTVIVTDPITTCTVTAQKNVTVNVSPVFSLIGFNPTSCLNADGYIDINLSTSSPASGPYTFFVFGPSGLIKSPVDVQSPNVPPANRTNNLAGGTYSISVQDQVNGCTVTKSIGLTNATFNFSVSTTSNCDSPAINIIPDSTTPPTPPWDYLVILGSTTVAQGTKSTSGNQAVTLPSQGFGTTATYTVQVTTGGCVRTVQHTVTTIASPGTLTITPSLCTNPATLSASGGTGTYTWTLPSGSTTTNNPLTISQGGTYSVTGTSTLPSGCKISATTSLIFNGTIVPNITQSDPCQTSVVATASPTGNFTYQWSNSSGPVSGGSSIAVNTTDTYTVTIKDTQTGCTTPPFSKLVNVIGPVTASLAATLACDDGSPFTLTATTNVASPTYAWTLNGTTIAGATTNPLDQTSAGTYKVTVSQSTCSATASLEIVKAPIPIGNLIPQDIICNSPDNANPDTKQRVLDPGIFVSYDWFKNDVSLNWTQRKYTATSEGVYRVDLTNEYDCTNSNIINLVQSCEPVVNAPNAFRPASSETVNKTFKVFNFFIDKDKFEIVIFNRWGEPVFESTNADFTWDGGYKIPAGGTPLPSGTYAYVVRYVSTFHPDMGVQEKRGGVVLLR